MRFDGKVVLVTGASRGIGREVARQFAEQGGTIAVHYKQNVDAARSTLKMLSGDGHKTFSADLADPAAVQSLVNAVVERMGDIDILINNAGIYEERPLTEVDYQEWQAHFQRVMSVNLLGPANLTLLCGPQDDRKRRWTHCQYFVARRLPWRTDGGGVWRQ